MTCAFNGKYQAIARFGMKYASAVHNAHVMRVSQKETKQKSALVNNLVQYMYV